MGTTGSIDSPVSKIPESESVIMKSSKTKNVKINDENKWQKQS